MGYRLLWLLVLPIALLAACSGQPEAARQSDPDRYHNSRFEAFLIMLTRMSRETVQPIPPAVPVDPKVARLGKQLFFSVELSADNTVACVNCHIIYQGGDDNQPVSIGIKGRRGELNALTVLNSGFNVAQFWDGRAATLEEQVEGPVTNHNEMGFSSFQQLVDKLAASDKWRRRFLEVFGEPPTEAGIKFAIAEFERSLITPGSRFDRYLSGDEDALTEQEKRGWQAFQNLGCIACHQGINLGGNLFQKAGIYESLSTGSAPGSTWLGRYRITGKEEDKYVFKVPGLRNVADTAPYFHDGSVPTLEEAVRRMIRAQLGLEADEKTVADIVAFLKTLSAPVKEVALAGT